MDSPAFRKPGGRNTQKGILFQNNIACRHLFELLIGANRVKTVTLESTDPVDDVVVTRLDAATVFYQAKATQSLQRWTVGKIKEHGILDQFIEQHRRSRGDCLLILSSSVPPGPLAELADSARTCHSYKDFQKFLLSSKDQSEWFSLIDHLERPEDGYRMLSVYYEEPWPPSPDQIREICKGRYKDFPQSASFDRIWSHLLAFAAERAVKGKAITRPDLIQWLREKSDGDSLDGVTSIEIDQARLPAMAAWYVNRAEESDVLSAINDLIDDKPRNLLVIGDGGTGKSSFFAWLVREYQKDPRLYLIDVAADGGEPAALLDSLANTIKEKFESRDPPPSAAKTSVEKLAWFVNKARDTQRKLVFAIDHVESLFSSLDLFDSRNRIVQARHNLFAAIAQTVSQGNVIWILFARSEHFFLMFPTLESQRAANISWVRLSEFSEEECVLLVERLSSIAGRRLTSDAIQVFVDNVPRTPQGIVLSFLSLIALSSESEISSRELVERRPWDDVFRQDYEGLVDDEKAIVYAIASLMESTSRRLFTAREIYESLPDRDRRELSVVNNVLHGLQENKYLVYQPSIGRYVLYHLNFARYVISRHDGVIQTARTSERFTEYAMVLAHEVKNSLQYLMHSVASLRKNALLESTDTPLRNEIERLDAVIRRMSHRIRAAEIVSLGAEQSVRVRYERVNLVPIVRRVIAMFGSTGRDVRFVFATQPAGLNPIVDGDEGLIETVLYQIIDNAAKYSFEHEPVFVEVAEKRSEVVLTVRNTGLKINNEDRERLFERGYRGNQARLATGSGSGWGLYIVSSVMKTLEGSAEIHADSNGAVIVTLSFPAKESG
jgi:signal transduction histidine kinase